MVWFLQAIEHFFFFFFFRGRVVVFFFWWGWQVLCFCPFKDHVVVSRVGIVGSNALFLARSGISGFV